MPHSFSSTLLHIHTYNRDRLTGYGPLEVQYIYKYIYIASSNSSFSSNGCSDAQKSVQVMIISPYSASCFED